MGGEAEKDLTNIASIEQDVTAGEADDAEVAGGGGGCFNTYKTGPTYNIGMQLPTSTFSGPIRDRLSRTNVVQLPGNCPICLESLEPGRGQALFSAECSHTFHFLCIASNVKYGNQMCPICRANWKDLPWKAGFEELNKRRTLGFSAQNLNASTSNFWMIGEPSHYDDDEPIIYQSISDLGSDSTSSSFWGRDLHLKLVAEAFAVPQCESRQCFTVLVHLKAPSVSIANSNAGSDLNLHASSRAPLDLVAVLDISGSMTGRKLLLLKQAMSFVIRNLSSADRLSVVVFSSTARRIFPLRRMNDDGQRQALQAVNALIATGATNISEGLLKGLKVLQECKQNNPVSSIMLLSDGRDTFNMITESLMPLFHRDASTTHGASSGHVQIPVHTFGFGSDHDASMLHTISEMSGGTFSYIEAEEVVQDAFAQCIGGLLSVVAQNVQLTISCSASGVFIGDIHSGSYDARIADGARDGTVELGYLYAEEERDVLVDLKLPALSMSEGSVTVPLLQATCIYKDPLKPDVFQNIADELSIMRPIVAEEGHEIVNLEVDRQRTRLRVVEAIAEARVLADQGSITAAQSVLCDARAQLSASRSVQAGDHLSHVLELDLKEIEDRMGSRELYDRSGRPYLLSSESSHSGQRATSRGDLSDYRTPTMVHMVNRSQTVRSSHQS